MNITDYLAEQKNRFETIVATYLNEVDSSLLPKNYGQLVAELKDYLLAGGKWHRPTVAQIGYRLSGGAAERQVEKGLASLELFHRYLLTHDDIVDQDFLRHGRPTLEKFYADYFAKEYPDKTDSIYSKGMAIIAGDVVAAMARDLSSQMTCKPEISMAFHSAVSQLLFDTAAGWQIQTEQNYMPIEAVSEADFVTGMELVSARYSFVWPLRIGQLLAGKPLPWNKHLDEYGYHVGLAFQIMDDYLGMFGDETKTGKPVGHDYREGKKSLFILRTYAQATEGEKNFLNNTLGNNPSEADIETAKKLILEKNVSDEVMGLARDHVSQAKQSLAQVESDDKEVLLLLEELADLTIYRSR